MDEEKGAEKGAVELHAAFVRNSADGHKKIKWKKTLHISSLCLPGG